MGGQSVCAVYERGGNNPKIVTQLDKTLSWLGKPLNQWLAASSNKIAKLVSNGIHRFNDY